MRNYFGSKSLRSQIKASLQVCHKSINKEKHSEREYRFFNSLAELYRQKEKIREYPKAVAIYQYLKKLIEKYLSSDKEKQALIEQTIRTVEGSFLGKVRLDIKVKEQEKDRELEVTDINVYKEELARFREGIKRELAAIENLGIEKDKEELNEKGLQKRTQEVERIYIEIREFFIGKRDEAGELTEPGLVNRLIEDCIKELGGLPRVREREKDEREVEYAIFGMGSLALGTMTPWSDLEFGILIEEGLGKNEEERVKEYFRNLTSLLHIKVVNFGETPLRMMGIEELNKFKITDNFHPVYNWFYDEFTNSGFSFDGPHYHACKTPLGRKNYKCQGGHEKNTDYELIGTPVQLSKMQESSWYKSDQDLVQALTHTIIVIGNKELHLDYKKLVNRIINNNMLRQIRAIKILHEDAEKYNPFLQLESNAEGAIFNIKKEIYRFPDRILTVLCDYLGSVEISSWQSINKLTKNAYKLDDRGINNLRVALSIATELRLKAYSHNNGQTEDFAALAKFEGTLTKDEKQEFDKVFYIKDLKVMYHFYYIVLALYKALKNITLESISALKTEIYFSTDALTKAQIHARFLKYRDAIREIEENQFIVDVRAKEFLAYLYNKIGKAGQALKLWGDIIYSEKCSQLNPSIVLSDIGNTFYRLAKYKEALKYLEMDCLIEMVSENVERRNVAVSLYNLGNIYYTLSNYEISLSYYLKSFELRKKIYGDKPHNEIAITLAGIGKCYQSLGKYENALKYKEKYLEMQKRIYKGQAHLEIAAALASYGGILLILGKYKQARKYYEDSLAMKLTIYGKQHHPDIALLINNIGVVLHELGKYEEALDKFKVSLKMGEEIYKNSHPDIANTYHNIGNSLLSMGKYLEALGYFKKSLQIKLEVYNDQPHLEITNTLHDMGNVLLRLARYEEAEKHFNDSLAMKKLIYKNQPNHPSIAMSLHGIANVAYDMGKYDEALHLREENLFKFTSLYSNGNHPHITRTLDGIADIYFHNDKYEAALDHYEESLKSIKELYQEQSHPEVARILNNLGVVLSKLCRYQEALIKFQESLKINESIYGRVHPAVALSMKNIGELLCDIGKYDESLEYYKRSLIIEKEIYKDQPNHPTIAKSLQSVGYIHFKLGNCSKAITELESGLKIMHQAYNGHTHPEIADVLNKIGYVLVELGRYEEALGKFSEVLEQNRKMYNSYYHSAIARSLNNMGYIFAQTCRYEEALEKFEESLKIKHLIYGKENLDVANTVNNVGCIFFKLGNYSKALEKFKEYKKMLEKIYMGSQPNIAYCWINIGITLDEQGLHDGALQAYQKGQDILEGIYKTKLHPDLGKIKINIGTALVQREDYDLAMKYWEEGLEILRNTFGETHLAIAMCLENIGVTWNRMGENAFDNKQEKYNKALYYCEQSLKIKRELNISDISNSLTNIGNALCGLKLYEKALNMYYEAVQVMLKLYNHKPHVDIAKCKQNIGSLLARQSRYEEAIEYYEESLNMLKSLDKNYTLNSIAHIHFYVGNAFYGLERYKEAREQYLRSLEIARKGSGLQSSFINQVFEKIGDLYSKVNNQEAALKYFKKSLEENEKACNGRLNLEIANILAKIGATLGDISIYDESLKYLKRAKHIYKELNCELHPEYNIILNWLEKCSYRKELERNNPSLTVSLRELARQKISKKPVFYAPNFSERKKKLIQSLGGKIKYITKSNYVAIEIDSQLLTKDIREVLEIDRVLLTITQQTDEKIKFLKKDNYITIESANHCTKFLVTFPKDRRALIKRLDKLYSTDINSLAFDSFVQSESERRIKQSSVKIAL